VAARQKATPSPRGFVRGFVCKRFLIVNKTLPSLHRSIRSEAMEALAEALSAAEGRRHLPLGPLLPEPLRGFD
jgi:hypothetical protein